MQSLRLASFALALGLAAAANCQERWQIKCIDDSGEPVAGAEVYVWQARRLPDGSSSQVQDGPFVSDARGLVQTAVALTYDGGKFSRGVYARVPGKLVGTLRFMKTSPTQAEPEAVVTLSPSRTIRGRVTVPDGFDHQSVLVKVASLSELGDGAFPIAWYPRSGIGLENILPERFDSRVAKDGSFEFHDFPLRPFVIFITEAKGLAHCQWSTVSMPDREMPEVVELQLAPETTLSGTVLDPGGQAVANAEVSLRWIDRRARFRWICTAMTDAKGAFRFDGLPDGEHVVSVETNAGVFRAARITLKRGEAKTDLALGLETGVELRGVVLDEHGKPVEGTTMHAITQKNDGDSLGSARSDPQGRFAMRIPAGAAYLYITSANIDRKRSDSGMDLQVEADDATLQQLRFDVTRAK